jgi:hypothetical protein
MHTAERNREREIGGGGLSMSKKEYCQEQDMEFKSPRSSKQFHTTERERVCVCVCVVGGREANTERERDR